MSIGRPVATEKRQEIYDLLVMGLSSKEISNRLFMTDAGVRYHMTEIYSIYDVDNHVQLIARHWIKKTGQLVNKKI